jgi:hypothetical protein
MTSITAPAPLTIASSRSAKVAKSVIAGRVISGIITALLFVDGAFKLFPVKEVIEGSAQLGYPIETMAPIGIILLTCVVLYAIPRTSVFGALLLTGYLGGAIATHVRVQNPLFSHILFPTYVAAMVWGGLYLRNPKLRALVSLGS